MTTSTDSSADTRFPAAIRALPTRTIALGTVGSLLILLSAFGAGGVLVRDPLLSRGPLSWVRYGHGLLLATGILYLGFGLIVWAWVRLGRHVLAGRVGGRAVAVASACWTVPLLFAPPLFTRDVYSYFAQGALALGGHDPYEVGPIALSDPDIVQNVHEFWQSTPAPYGPLFVLLAKGVAAVAGNNMILGVVLMRLVLVVGLGLLVWALPRLVRHLGGTVRVAMWLAVAGPMTVVHLVGGPHNDLLMVGLLAAGTALVLDRRHVAGIVLVSLAVAVKATAALALPFLVWVWAGHLESTPLRRFVRACAAAVLTFVVTFAATTLVAGVDLGWLGSLDSSSNIVNWLSLPTAVGEFVHWVVGIDDAYKSWFVNIARGIGALIFLVIAVRQWWWARDGGVDAVRRMALVLFAVAILSPATLPWYLTWSFVIAAALPWSRKHLKILVGVCVFLVLTYSPDGEVDLLYNWRVMALALALSVLAGISLTRNDPLGLFAGPEELSVPKKSPAKNPEKPTAEPATGPVENRAVQDPTVPSGYPEA